MSSDKTQIDVVTLAIPRGLMRDCVPAFLAAIGDRANFHLRWICSVDNCPGLEEHWSEECEAAEAIAPQFDDIHKIFARKHRGFGHVVEDTLKAVKHDMLFVMDDWNWARKRFDLQIVLDATKDCFSFWGPDTKAGGMHPTFWRKHVVDYLRTHMPDNVKSFTETTAFVLLKRRFRMTGMSLLSNEENHVGPKRMLELGLTHNCFGQRLNAKQKLHRPVWDEATESFVKQ